MAHRGTAAPVLAGCGGWAALWRRMAARAAADGAPRRDGRLRRHVRIG